MRKGFLIYGEMCKYFPMCEEAVSHKWLCNCSILNFLIYEENFLFFFISVVCCTVDIEPGAAGYGAYSVGGPAGVQPPVTREHRRHVQVAHHQAFRRQVLTNQDPASGNNELLLVGSHQPELCNGKNIGMWPVGILHQKIVNCDWLDLTNRNQVTEIATIWLTRTLSVYLKDGTGQDPVPG